MKRLLGTVLLAISASASLGQPGQNYPPLESHGSSTRPALTLGDGWTHIETDQPCIVVIGDRLQIRNDTGAKQRFWVTVSNDELGFSASYRVDLPETGAFIGNLPELAKADHITLTRIGDGHSVLYSENAVGVRARVPSRDEAYPSSIVSECMSYSSTGIGLGNANLAYELRLIESTGREGSASSKTFNPGSGLAPDWWLSSEQIESLLENED